MRFERKIFIAVFLSTLAVGLVLILVAQRYVSTKSRDDFISRYRVFTHVLADTLTRLDTDTETLMLNAAQVVAARDAQKGLLSTDELKTMRSKLGVTHIFMVDKGGNFIRSTNEDPHLIPNLYSFCDDYRGLLKGTYTDDATPIIKPRPEPKPYKFLFIPNTTKERIVEIGVRVDSIAKTMVEAIKADRNVKAMNLYSPDGTSFGKFSSEDVVFGDSKTQLPNDLSAISEDQAVAHFFSKVVSSHPKCCQCDVSGTSRNGEYYYVLESSVSKDELNAVQARIRLIAVLLALGNLIVSFLLAKILSRRLVSNVRTAVHRVRAIKQNGSLSERIGLEGPDEVIFLTKEFDHLLASLESSQRRLVEAEKAESKIELARIVAHNMKSPLVAIEMMIPQMIMIPERTRRILASSVSEIRQLADKLRNKPEAVFEERIQAGHGEELVYLPLLIEDVIKQKQIEYSQDDNVAITFVRGENFNFAFIKVGSTDLRMILSNLINNAIESYGGGKGAVEVGLSSFDKKCAISVSDRGCGIPDEYLKDLGRKQLTFKGENGRGLGLLHARRTVEEWGGELNIQSTLGVGTSVDIHLPRYAEKSSDVQTFPDMGAV